MFSKEKSPELPTDTASLRFLFPMSHQSLWFIFLLDCFGFWEIISLLFSLKVFLEIFLLRRYFWYNKWILAESLWPIVNKHILIWGLLPKLVTKVESRCRTLKYLERALMRWIEVVDLEQYFCKALVLGTFMIWIRWIRLSFGNLIASFIQMEVLWKGRQAHQWLFNSLPFGFDVW